MAHALSHIKVLDLGHHIAGPYCSRLLADYGAEVIKVEMPGEGDGARRQGPFLHDVPHPEKSGLFLYLNYNKRAITLNLKTDSGRKLFKELVRDADVLVENFEPRVMAGLGLDYRALEEINPRLVMTSISNFGQSGPYRDFKASELVVYAMGGLMYIIGAYDREPLKHGLSQGQYLAAATAASATMAAIYARGDEGVGQHIDVAIAESIMMGMFMHAGPYGYQGAVMRRQPKVGAIFDDVMTTKDGYIAPVFYGYVDWDAFSRFMDCPELADPKFGSLAGRLMNSAEFEALLLPKIAQWYKDDLFHAAQEWRFAFGIVNTPEDLVKCPQLQERGFFVDIDHPLAGRLTYPGPPFKMSQTPAQVHRAAPLMGQHNEEVYGALGYTRADLVALREREVI